MDRITLKTIALACISLAAAILFSACPLADPLELRAEIEERVAAAGKVGTPQISITQESTEIIGGAVFDIGSAVALTSKDVIFTITNPGSASLYLTGAPVVAITGTNQSEFSIQLTPASPVAINGSSTFALRFSPTTAGAKSITLTLINSSSDSSFNFSVTATATPQDLQAPTGSVAINAGSVYSQVTSVTLGITATDLGGGSVSQMEVKNDNAFTGNWQAYVSSLPWTLAGPDGTNTVYIRFRDTSGNISSTYSDVIVLDRVNPTVSTFSPVNGALYQSRFLNAVVNFSESIDQTTLNSSNVFLRLRGSYPVSTNITKTATSVTLAPLNNLAYGIDYTIVLTNGVKDLSGRSLTDTTSEFAVERDFWEGYYGNDYPFYNNPPGNQQSAFILSEQIFINDWGNVYDFFPTTPEEGDMIPSYVHSKLAVLEGTDYYVLYPPPGSVLLYIYVYFSTDEFDGSIVDSSGSDQLKLSVNQAGAGLVPYDTPVDNIYERRYEYDVSDGNEIYIMISEVNDSYGNRRTYNLSYMFEPGI